MYIKINFNIYSTILLRSVSDAGQCLVNTPAAPLTTYYNSTILPGQLYTVDQQCQFLYGPNSNYANCLVE